MVICFTEFVLVVLTDATIRLGSLSYAQPQQVGHVQKKMMEIMTQEVWANDLKGVGNRLIPDSTGNDTEKARQCVYPLHVSLLEKPKR